MKTCPREVNLGLGGTLLVRRFGMRDFKYEAAPRRHTGEQKEKSTLSNSEKLRGDNFKGGLPGPACFIWYGPHLTINSAKLR
jgi:hypothetical protein